MSEREMLDLLLDRYTNIRRGTIADRWTRAEHVASDLGHRRKGLRHTPNRPHTARETDLRSAL